MQPDAFRKLEKSKTYRKKVLIPENQVRNRLPKIVRRSDRNKFHARATLRTLTVLIPRAYNTDAASVRKRVELWKPGAHIAEKCGGCFRDIALQPMGGWIATTALAREFETVTSVSTLICRSHH